MKNLLTVSLYLQSLAKKDTKKKWPEEEVCCIIFQDKDTICFKYQLLVGLKHKPQTPLGNMQLFHSWGRLNIIVIS